MNTQSNAISEAFDSQRVMPAVMATTRPLYWSVRRELWENRSLYIAPLAVAAVILFGFLINTIGLPHRLLDLWGLDPAEQRKHVALPYDMAAGLMMLTGMIVGAFYCLDALYGERRDRSILFWKSLPVSDLTAVLAKASVPLVILPAIIFSITVATQWIMLMLNSAVFLAKGMSLIGLWSQVAFFQSSLLLLYHLYAVHALWHAPFYGWMLFVSSWARRATLLWATLPVIAIAALEKILFNTTHFVGLLGYRLSGGGEDALTTPNSMPMDPTTHLTPLRFLSTPGLWMGLLFTALCVLAAVRLRRSRGPI